MNTDNLSIAGETIDYGPCAFMDTFHPARVYSASDIPGRYAYGNQPRIAQWNLVRSAQALLPQLGDDEDAAINAAQEAIETFPAGFEAAYLAGLGRKLGLAQEREGDMALAQDLLDRMTKNKADFTLTFRRLSDSAGAGPDANGPIRSLFDDPAAFDGWAAKWRQRPAQEGGPPAGPPGAPVAGHPPLNPRTPQGRDATPGAPNRSQLTPP